MRIDLAAADIIILLAYAAGLLIIGRFRRSRTELSETDYLLGSRRLTVPVFVFTLVSTWYGGILGTGEFTWRYGITNWLVFGLPYYIFALIFAFFFAEPIWRRKTVSIPDLIQSHYGGRSGIVAAGFVAVLISPAPYLLTAAVLLDLLLPGGLLFWTVFTAAFSFFYLRKTGFQAVVLTDILQFLLMFTAFTVLAVILTVHYSPGETFSRDLPAGHLIPGSGLTAGYILTWFFIAVWTLIDPGFHQRCAAAESPGTAKKGILVSILFWFVFDGLTVYTGLYARALLPDLAEPLQAFPLLAEKVLPAGVLGLFFTGLAATVMSTLDSYFFLSAQTLSHDILDRLRPDGSRQRHMTAGFLLTAAAAVLLSIYLPSVIGLWFTIGTLIIPALLIPVTLALFNIPMPTGYFSISAITASGVSLLFFILRTLAVFPFDRGPEAFYPGILTSLLLAIIFFRSGKISTT